jgi:hypothetical protein
VGSLNPVVDYRVKGFLKTEEMSSLQNDLLYATYWAFSVFGLEARCSLLGVPAALDVPFR